MPSRTPLRALAEQERPLISPVAHDALSARLIALAGFKAIAIGGSSMLAARYGIPDLGLAALGEMVDGAREIVAATDLPCVIDADDGYGDVKSVARTMEVYQRLGVAAVVLEDQLREAKQPGDSKARSLAPAASVAEKLAVCRGSRHDPDLMIIARTDAYAPEGLDGALRRAEAYLQAGADGIFIPGIVRPEEVARAGAAFRGTYHMIVMTEGGKTPWLPPAELHDMGYSHVTYPSYIIMRAVLAMSQAAAELRDRTRAGAAPLPLPDIEAARTAFQCAVRQREWEAVGQTP